MTDFAGFQSPFSWRYGSPAMRGIWSEEHKRKLWRSLWVALAEAQVEWSLVTPAQVDELKEHVHDVDVARALEIEAVNHHDLMAELKVYTAQCPNAGGILHLGASVREEVSARMAIADPRFSQLQFPYNLDDPRFSEIIDEATAAGKFVWTNRPLKMGALVGANATPDELTRCFGFVLAKRSTGAVLCGTASANHLRANLMAFRQAVNARPNP